MSKNFLKSLVGFAFVSIFALGSFGCQKAQIEVVVADKPVVQAEAEKKVLNEGWYLYTDTMAGFSISYPLAKDSEVDAKLGVVLPDAIGEKDRTLKIETFDTAKVVLDSDGCINQGEQTPSMKGKQKIHGIDFCISSFDEGAAGSTYRTYHYTTKAVKIVDVAMTIRFPTSVAIYEGCENEDALSLPKCSELAFDESRDIKLFKDIMKTFELL
jgi:hypothetical protein